MGGSGMGQNGGGGIGGIGAYMSQGQQPSGFGGGVSLGSGGPPNSWNPNQPGMGGLGMIMDLFNNPNPAFMSSFLQQVRNAVGRGGGAVPGPGGPPQSIGGPYRHIA